MPRFVFKHLRNTKNVGDRWCSPFDYLSFDDAVAIDLNEPTPPCEAVIFGGGKIFGSLANNIKINDKMAKQRIAWGVSTVQSSMLSLRYWRSRRYMTIVGSRDFGDTRYEYAPCITCMSPLFDQIHESKNELVFYLHKTKSISINLNIPSNVPVLDNYCSSMEDAIRFIGSGDVVVSNSYHGVYWALLLGKKVMCLPFSNKFGYYRLPPAYSNEKQWKKDLSQAKSQKDMLLLCREASIDFERKIRSTIRG